MITAVECATAMSIVAKRSVRFASGVAFVGAAVACGSQGLGGPYEGDLGGDFGFVGSGGRGSGYGRDGGSDGGRRDEGLDGGGSAEGSPGVDAGGDNGADGGNGGQDDGGGDGGSTVAVTFDWPPGVFLFLDWVISGPSGYYSGTIYFSDAHSLEFVTGGIQAGSGYTITLAGNDRDGAPCSGTSNSFEVFPGQVSGVGVLLTCARAAGDASEPAHVTTGSVAVEAGVVLHDM